MKVAIVGSGNAGCAHACMLTARGHTVNLIKTSNSMHDENYNKIIQQNGLNYYQPGTDEIKFAELNLITRDIAKGLSGVDIVMVMTQTLQHHRIKELIMPFLDGVQLLFIVPGYAGSLLFSEAYTKYGTIIAEGESTAFDARIIEPGTVKVLFQNVRNKLGFWPNSKKAQGLTIAQSLIETYVGARTNVIESAMHNPNLVVHTIGSIMSSSRIEYSKGEFWMYREAFTPSIWNLIQQLDEEKNKVIEAFGGTPSPYLEECKFRNEEDLTQDAMAAFQAYADDGGPKGPDKVYSRYMYEDVPMGLGLLNDLSKIIGNPANLACSLITIASGLLNKNLLAEARTIKGLAGKEMKAKMLIEFINR